MSDTILASRKRRIFALLIDHVVITFICTYAAFIVFGLNIESLLFEEAVGPFVSIGFLSLVLFIIKDSVNGLSLGKYILGIRVRDVKNGLESVSPFKTMLRNVFLIAWPIEFIAMIISSSKKRMGDYVSGTIVLRDRSIKLYKRLPVFILLLFALSHSFQISNYSIIENSSAFKIAVKHLKESGNLEVLVGPIQSIEVNQLGSVSIHNGEGSATLYLLVVGETRNQPVTLTLHKSENKIWEVTSISMENEISL